MKGDIVTKRILKTAGMALAGMTVLLVVIYLAIYGFMLLVPYD
jgi:hypothetical protein